jgi:tricorn protease
MHKRQQDIYEMFFTQEAYDKPKLSKAEYDILTDSEAEQKKKKELRKRTRTKKPRRIPRKKTEPVAIDLNNIEDRITPLTLGSAQIADGILTADGETLLYLVKSEKGYELWSLKSRESESKRLWDTEAPNPSPFSDSDPATIHLDKDGKYAFILAGGRITKVGVADGKAEPAKFNAGLLRS